MSSLPKLRAIRGGHRGAVTKVLKKALDSLPPSVLDIGDDNALRLLLSELALASTTIETKLTLLEKLNNDVLAVMDDDDSSALETEVLESADFEEQARVQLLKVKLFLDSARSPTLSSATTTSPPPAADHHSSSSPDPSPSPATAMQPSPPMATQSPSTVAPSPSSTNSPAPANTGSVSSTGTTTSAGPDHSIAGTVASDVDSAGQLQHAQRQLSSPAAATPLSHQRLPKLVLPTFSGDPLSWQTFWDSFSTAVDANTTIAPVQKLNYLRAQLTASALSCIAGLPTSNDNYTRAVDLLRERFGQPHRVVQAHMQALMALEHPSTTAASLRSF